jgi:hypothetical protein
MSRESDGLEALESRLRAYRPSGPPEGLRNAVIGFRGPRHAIRGWLAIAALLLIAITLRWGARTGAVEDDEWVDPSPVVLTPGNGSVDPLAAAIRHAAEHDARAEALRTLAPPPFLE